MHVADSYQIEAVLVRYENLVTPRPEDSSLPDLGPSIQVLEPTALVEVADQVYEAVLHEEVRHSLAPQAPCFCELSVQCCLEPGMCTPLVLSVHPY